MNTEQFEGHMMDEDYQVWCWSKETLKKAENMKQLNATAALLRAAPDLLAEVKRLREQVECSKGEHEWELDDYLDGDPNEPVRIVETCAACGLVRERIE